MIRSHANFTDRFSALSRLNDIPELSCNGAWQATAGSAPDLGYVLLLTKAGSS